MRALDSFFESGGEVPEGGADAPMGDAGEDDESGDDLDEEQLGRAEAGAGTVPVCFLAFIFAKCAQIFQSPRSKFLRVLGAAFAAI